MTKVALVVGGASGLGLATTQALAKDGYDVVVLDRNAAGDEIAGDVTSEADVQRAVDVAVGRGDLRVVVNCAGIGIPGRTVERDGSPMPLATFQKLVDVNLVGTFNVVRLAAAAMAKQDPDEGGERGVIVNTASCAAFDGQAGQVPYSASKAAVVGMTLPLARDLAPLGIRAVTIAPGTFDTPLYNPPAELLDQVPGLKQKIDTMHARIAEDFLFPRREGVPDEFAALVVHIAGNRYLNAEVIRLDGGLRTRAK